MMLTVAIWVIIALLALFAAAGAVLLVQGLRVNAVGADGLSLRERMDRYVGPVKPEMALLSPRPRVAVEFLGALCGFPGLGWLASGRVWAGLVLLVGGSGLVWGFIPVALAFSGLLLRSPYAATAYLPGLAVVSASALAIDQWVVRKVTT